MAKVCLYHGTSAENARLIEAHGFVPDKFYNWDVKSKKGFVYLSLAYAPFYVMKHNCKELAIVKVEVDEQDLYPKDDFLMAAKFGIAIGALLFMLFVVRHSRRIQAKAVPNEEMFDFEESF